MTAKIVAEISGNHGGVKDKALALICEAAAAGCDYVKFQYYRPDDMPDRLEGDNEEMYRKLMVHDDWLPRMFSVAEACGVGLFASVFSVARAIDILNFDVEFVKLASPKSTRLPPEEYYNIIEVLPPDVEVITSCDNDDWIQVGIGISKVLYCPEGHPPDITGLDFIAFRRHNYYGFSDHTSGTRTPMAFIRAGAKMVEKHFKLEGDTCCIDAAFSIEPRKMKQLCRLAHNE